MKKITPYLLLGFIMLSLNACSSDEETTNGELTPSQSALLPTSEYTKSKLLPSTDDDVRMSVLFDVDDVLWYNSKTGEIKFHQDYSIDELYQKGYFSHIGDNSSDLKYKTFVFTSSIFSQIVNCPVLHQYISNNDTKYFLARGYPFDIHAESPEAMQRHQAQRDAKLEELLPSWFDFLHKLRTAGKLK